jgi:hypothetical protein
MPINKPTTGRLAWFSFNFPAASATDRSDGIIDIDELVAESELAGYMLP